MKFDRYRGGRPRRGGMAATLPLVAGALALGIPAAQAADPPRPGHPGRHQARLGHGQAGPGRHRRQPQGHRPRLPRRPGRQGARRRTRRPCPTRLGRVRQVPERHSRPGPASAPTKAQMAAVSRLADGPGLKVTGITSTTSPSPVKWPPPRRRSAPSCTTTPRTARTYRAPSKAATVPASLDGAVLTVTGLDNAPKQGRATHERTLPPPDAVFKNAGPVLHVLRLEDRQERCPSAYGAQGAVRRQGLHRQAAARRLRRRARDTGKGVTRRHHRRLRLADHRRRTPPLRQAQRRPRLPQAASSTRCCRPTTRTPRSATRPAGTARRPSTSRPCTRSRPPRTSSTSAARPAPTTICWTRSARSSTTSWPTSSPTPGATSRPTRPRTSRAAYDQVFQLGAVEGIGFYFSSGDNGDDVATTGTKQVDIPANSAWVTAVGGTSLAVGKGDTYQWETGWGTAKATLSADGNELDRLPRRVHLGRGRRHQQDGAAAVLPAGRRARRARQANGGDADARRPGHRGGRRPQHRLPGRPDADLPGRVAPVRRVPHRRHLAGRAGDRGRPGAGPAGAAAARPIGFANPAIYARYGTAVVPRRDGPSAGRRASPRRGPRRLRQQLRRRGRPG